MRSRRGSIVIALLAGLVVVLGAALGLSKTRLFHGESRRAAASQSATAQVVTAVAQVDTAQQAKAATAAASVAKIGEANAAAPDSPAKQFIAREVPLAAAQLPAPDPAALLAAEQRRAAIFEGKWSEAARLYDQAAQHAGQLQAQLDQATAARDTAFAARHAADLALSEAAAAHLAAERQRAILIAVAVALLLLWLYAKFAGVSTASIGKMVTDIRAGTPAIQAIDTYLAPWHIAAVKKTVQLATDPAAPAVKLT